MQFNEGAQLNDSSCLACKRLKRRCSREQPACSLCLRTDRQCQYPSYRTVDEASLVSTLQARIRELEDKLSSSAGPEARKPVTSSLPSSLLSQANPSGGTSLEHQNGQDLALLFLDSVACRNSEPCFWQTIEAALSQHAESPFTTAELQRLVRYHSQTTHTWLPISECAPINRPQDVL